MKINLVSKDGMYLTDDEIPEEKNIEIISSYIFKDDAGDIEMFCKLSLTYTDLCRERRGPNEDRL